MDDNRVTNVLHWNYRGFTEFPLQKLQGEESEITDIYLKENLISRIPSDIYKLRNLESLYFSGNDITELPREISTLRCLKCLDVSGNRLRYIPEEIAEARNLKFLILDENELCKLPLRLGELRMLRYLSVCDNKLQWLPQRPVFNYHHCELRFWRNENLKTIPYSLWYQMFREQQTRSLNIGCLNFSKGHNISQTGKCCLKILNDSCDYEAYITFPENYNHILHGKRLTPPSLFELSKRKFYQVICKAIKNLNDVHISIYSDKVNTYNKKMTKLQENFKEIGLYNEAQEENENNNDNNSNCGSVIENYQDSFLKSRKTYVVPAVIINEFYDYLPHFIKNELSNGPVSNCENILCKTPLFDYVYPEFCMQKIILIDKTEDVTLSATFCSKSCADSWKTEKKVIEWELL